jgi:hypothetical protein
MQSTSKKYRVGLFIFLLALLCFPYAQSKFNIIKMPPLQGAYATPPKNAKVNIKDWLSGDYQAKKEDYLKNSFGFRDYLIRIHNQFEYSLYHKVNAKDVIVGKNNYLFEIHYIQGYYGTDFAGMDSINNSMGRLKFINDTLKKLGKSLLLIIAPSKAEFYPEYIPDNYKTPKTNTNYNSYLKQIKESGIDYIDFNGYFVENKNKSKYPLMPINGVHWSMYGVGLAGDSIVKYIEKERHIIMPQAVWKNIRIGKDEGFDVDMENAMNLILPLPSPPMAYPEIKFKKDSTKTRPNVLVVGDSYYWGLVAGYDIEHGFSRKSDFWYYYKKLEHGTVTRQQLKDEIAKEDVIIILATAHNWGDIGWGFIEDTYDLFKGIIPIPFDKEKYRQKLEYIKNVIRNDKNWYAKIVAGAKEKNISLDSALNANAAWMIEHTKQ